MPIINCRLLTLKYYFEITQNYYLFITIKYRKMLEKTLLS